MGNENKKGRKKKEIGYNSVFATRLRDLMEQNNTTQPQLAEAVGVSRQAVGQWKDGNTVPDILDFQKIADYYNVSADYLLGRSKSQSNDKDLKAVADYLGVSDYSVVVIRWLSKKISDDEYNEYSDSNGYGYSELPHSDLKNGFVSSQADICDWVITNMLYDIHYTIGAALAQMYRLERYDDLYSSLAFNISFSPYSDFVHLLINTMTDDCRHRVDRLITKCSDNVKNKKGKYYSIYDGSFVIRKHSYSSVEEVERIQKEKEDFPF